MTFETSQPPTDEQLNEYEALHTAATPGPWHCTDSGAIVAPLTQQHVADVWEPSAASRNGEFIEAARAALPALVDEIRRLRARVTELESNLGTPVLGGVAAPARSRAYEDMERARAELDKGFTDQEWAVGRIVCPEGFSCVSHPLAVFEPTKRGRLPVHRHQTFHTVCKGSGKKPTTPPLQLRTVPVSA